MPAKCSIGGVLQPPGLTVGHRLHAEAQQGVQKVHDVVQGVLVHILPHGLAELQLVQLVQAGQAVLGLVGVGGVRVGG